MKKQNRKKVVGIDTKINGLEFDLQQVRDVMEKKGVKITEETPLQIIGEKQGREYYLPIRGDLVNMADFLKTYEVRLVQEIEKLEKELEAL